MPASQYPENPDPAGFGVYVHWPFCAAKCPYCDFNSHVRHGGVDQAAFVAGYAREVGAIRALTGPRTVASIFFGGGTPSLMAPDTLEALLELVHGAWRVAPDAEVTLEANPNSVDAGRFSAYRAAGVNRVSIGVQALNDQDLRALGRLHTAREALAAVETAAKTFDRYSFDLIYARPDRSAQHWREELARALTLGARHLSLYQLTIEAGTPFALLQQAGKLAIPAADSADQLYRITQDLTAAAGLPAYEISNHAAAGEESRHNMLYWRYGEYAGLGPGAHGRIMVAGQRIATASERQPERWLERCRTAGDAFIAYEPLTPTEQADECLLMGLRIGEGISLRRLAEIGGVIPQQATIDDLVARGLLAICNDGDGLCATARGRFILNRLVLELSARFEPA